MCKWFSNFVQDDLTKSSKAEGFLLILTLIFYGIFLWSFTVSSSIKDIIYLFPALLYVYVRSSRKSSSIGIVWSAFGALFVVAFQLMING